MSIEELKTLVGRPYTEFDKAGNYFGCFEPLYFLYPEAPRFKLPENKEDFYDFALNRIQETLEQIDCNEISEGDVIVFKHPFNVLHIGIYLGDFKIIQVFKNSTMTINKIDLDNKRIVGVFRERRNYD